MKIQIKQHYFFYIYALFVENTDMFDNFLNPVIIKI